MSDGKRDYLSRMETIGIFNFEWHSQNKVGNIAILVLWRAVKPVTDYGLPFISAS